MLDLAYDEDSQAEVDMNVVMTGAGEFVELQATGEKSTFNEARLVEMIAFARTGLNELFAAQREILAR
jgi:ribonuclease PH